MVYLIHFDEPYKHAKHYLGFSTHLEKRLAHHKAGSGSCLMRALNKAQIGWQVVRTWDGDGHLEQELKRQKNSPRLCPICNSKGGDASRF